MHIAIEAMVTGGQTDLCAGMWDAFKCLRGSACACVRACVRVLCVHVCLCACARACLLLTNLFLKAAVHKNPTCSILIFTDGFPTVVSGTCMLMGCLKK